MQSSFTTISIPPSRESRFCPKTASLIFSSITSLQPSFHSFYSCPRLIHNPSSFFLQLSCSSFTIHLSYFIARQQACIQIAATIYTQACPRTSLFCFLLYQLSLWWVKYRAQPEAINPWKHAGPNAPWQAETSWGEKVKPRKPAWNQAFLWLSILFHTPLYS